MTRLPETPRHVAVAVALQLYGNVDPDTSRYLADHIIFAVDRAEWRGHADSGPTHAEVNRALSTLALRDIHLNHDDVYAALLAALCPGLIKEGELAA